MTLIEVADPKKVVHGAKHLFELIPPRRRLSSVNQLVPTFHSFV
jgi:hypothetical protein